MCIIYYNNNNNDDDDDDDRDNIIIIIMYSPLLSAGRRTGLALVRAPELTAGRIMCLRAAVVVVVVLNSI